MRVRGAGGGAEGEPDLKDGAFLGSAQGRLCIQWQLWVGACMYPGPSHLEICEVGRLAGVVLTRGRKGSWIMSLGRK